MVDAELYTFVLMPPSNPYCYEHPRPAVAADAVVFGFDRKEERTYVLLIRRGKPPFEEKWAFPGGFLHMDESAEEACRRELKEETGMEAGHLEQLGAFTDPERDPRGRILSVAHYTLVDKNGTALKAGDDAGEARWFSLDELPGLAFDHAEILEFALQHLGHLLDVQKNR